jgi:hypothetical protein
MLMCDIFNMVGYVRLKDFTRNLFAVSALCLSIYLSASYPLSLSKNKKQKNN